MPFARRPVGPFGEQLAAPLVVPAGGARERERAHAVGMHHADDLRDDAAHRRADDVRALDALGVEHRDRVVRPCARGRTGPAARRSGRCRGCRARCSGGGARTRPAAAPSRGGRRRGPGSSAPASRRAGPTCCTRCVDAVVVRTVADMTARLPASTTSSCVESEPATRVARIASAKRAAASGSSGSYGSGSVTSGPKRTSHGPIAAPKRPPGVHRGGHDRRVRQRLQRARGARRPRRSAATWARAGPRRGGRRAARRATSGALLEIAPSRRVTVRRTGRRARRRRAAARRSRARTATPSAAGSATPKPRFETIDRGTGLRDVLAARDVDADRRVEQRRRRGRRVAGRGRTGRRGSGRRHGAGPRRGAVRTCAMRSTSSRSRSPIVGRRRSSCRPASPRSRSATTSAHSNSSRSTSCVGTRSASPSSSTARSARRRCSRGAAARSTCGAIAAPGELDDARRDVPERPGSTGSGTRPPRRAACHGVAAPRTDDVAAGRRAGARSRRPSRGGVVGVQQRERRVGRTRARARPAAAAAGRAGSGRATRPPGAYRSAHDRHAVAQRARPRPSASTASSERPYGVARLGHDVFVGTDTRAGRRAVHLEPAAHDDVLERCRRARAALSVAIVHSSVRSTADAGVMRDAGSYTPKCATTFGANSSTNSASRSRSRGSMRRNSRAAQPPAGRHEVDADHLVGPVALLDQLRDARAELAAHPGDEHPFTAHRRDLRLRAQVREQDHLADRRHARQQHHQPVDAEPHAAGRRQAVLERAHVVGVDAVRLRRRRAASARPAPRSGAAGRPGRSAR